MRINKLVAISLSVILAAGTLSGCGSKTEQTSTQNGTAAASNMAASAVFADTQCPTSLDLADSWNSWYTMRYGITETLYKLDEDLNPQPFLAKSCEMKDDKTWVITLRDDVTFQNDNKMTADSVKQCWERTAGINARLAETLYIDSMEADGQTLTVKTTKAVPAFLNAICEPLTGIVDATAEDMANVPIGTGPFIPTSYEVKGTVEVKRYDNYWGGTPKLETATFHVIADTESLSMAQQSGESDLSVSMPSTSLELFQNNDSYNVDSVAGSRGQVLFMNYDNQYIQDIAVRKALSMSIDKESYANIINKGASVPATGLYPDFTDYKANDGEGYAFDLEGAKKVLSDAGYTDSNNDGYVEKDGNGTNVSLRIVTYSTKAELSSFCEEMSAKAKEIGIDLKVEVYESVAEQQKSGDFDLMLISFTMMPTGDPQYFADIVFKSTGTSNYGHYSNADVDALIDQLDAEFDAAKRTELAKQIQSKILEDAGYIVIGHSKYTYVMNSSVKDLKSNPSEYYLLDANTYVEK